MGRRRRIVTSLLIVAIGVLAAQTGAFSVGVLLVSPDRLLFWTLLTGSFVVANIACFGLLRLWAEPWARRRLRQL